MNAIATTRCLGFAYGGASRCALHDVDLAIAQGELALVAGPSGAGKSTLLRCFNGLVPHFHGGRFSGQVVVGGMDTRSHQPRDLARVAGMVFQEPEAQAVARTVQEEIVFGLENRGAAPSAIRKRLEEVLDALGIATLRTRELKTLSGGELQRVAIAAVLTMQPSLILLDEPTSQLDPQAADAVLRLVRDLRDDLGLAVAVTEHRLERIAAYADRVLHVPGDGSVRVMETREAMAMLPGAPPVSRIGRAIGWAPLPLSVAEARAFLNGDARPAAAVAPASAHGDVIASLRGVLVELAGREVLRISELALHEGERVAVMGRNGAGKTTLLRTIAGLQPAASGVVGGPAASAASTRFRDIAYVPQDPAASLYKPTIESEIEDVLQGTGRTGTIEEAIAEWDLQAFAERDARDLSVGERQRAALAAMLAGRPRLILLDEPTRGMDAGAKELLIANLGQRAREGACVVLASHDVELAASFADRVILLSEGDLVADEPVREALTGNVAFSTQASKLFGPGVLTAEDAIALAKGGGR